MQLTRSVKHDPKQRLDEIIVKLRELNFRITPQRVAILRIFLNSQDHPSVEQVYAQVKADFPSTSLATVYKTVNLLKEVGEILEISFAGGGNRYDGIKPYPHPHLICTTCNKIMDSEIGLVDQIANELEQTSGYRIVSHQIEFFGTCPACQKK
ncbi:MAG: transcriptional repressor [Desulfuromonadales bacterium]|nr:transcriptional repressor [Desulfuromonadales bacterium]